MVINNVLHFMAHFFLSPQILKYTPENHFDRANLETALEKAEDLCQQVRRIAADL